MPDLCMLAWHVLPPRDCWYMPLFAGIEESPANAGKHLLMQAHPPRMRVNARLMRVKKNWLFYHMHARYEYGPLSDIETMQCTDGKSGQNVKNGHGRFLAEAGRGGGCGRPESVLFAGNHRGIDDSRPTFILQLGLVAGGDFSLSNL